MGCRRAVRSFTEKKNSRELCSYRSNLKSGNKPDRTSKDDFLAAALFSGNSGGAKSNPHNITCIFCKQDHTSSKCNMITGVNSRKAILKSKGKCFVYDPVTRHPNVNRQINVTNAYLDITFLFVIFILHVQRKQMKINEIQIIQPCLL